MTVTLLKTSPLDESYRRNGAHFVDIQGWTIPMHCGNPSKEKEHLEKGSVLVDWSHIGKITLRGGDAADAAAQIEPKASSLKPMQSYAVADRVILRLTHDEFLILCKSNHEASIIAKVQAPGIGLLNHGGGLGCLVLGGKLRYEVIERSSAMNLRFDIVPEGSVVQTSVHMVPCTIYRTASLDIMVHTRDFSESLFDALMDVGYQVGLIPSGIATLPVSFSIQ